MRTLWRLAKRQVASSRKRFELLKSRSSFRSMSVPGVPVLPSSETVVLVSSRKVPRDAVKVSFSRPPSDSAERAYTGQPMAAIPTITNRVLFHEFSSMLWLPTTHFRAQIVATGQTQAGKFLNVRSVFSIAYFGKSSVTLNRNPTPSGPLFRLSTQ